ncbi:MAG: hypothetical protein V4584_08670 [Verrucomicrobiota bacterium]
MKRSFLTTALVLAGISASDAAITYVDATSGVSGNTTLASGGTFSPPLNGTTGSDNQWEQRTVFGSSGTIFEANGEVTTENAPRLAVTIPVSDGTYEIFAYFWSPGTGDANQQWLLRAGLTNDAGELPLHSRTLTGLATPVNPSGMLVATQVTSTAGFAVAPTVITEASGGRVLWQASLGQVVVSNGSTQVFIDDYSPVTTVNNRTWFDGVGYELIPEPSSALLGLFGAVTLVRRRR